MNKIKRFLIGLLCAVSVSALALGFSACADEKPSGEVPSIGGGFGGGSSNDDDDNNNDNNQGGNANQGGGNTNDDENTDQGGGNTDGVHTCVYDSITPIATKTCTQDGVELQVCSACGQGKYVTYKAEGHSLTTVAGQAVTCTENGWTEYQKCQNSGCTYTENYQTLQTDGHDWDNGELIASTCLDGGYTLYSCTQCPETKTENPTQATGVHTYVNAICSTCDNEGLTFALNDNGTYYSVTGLADTNYTDIEIPATYENKPICAFTDGAFKNSAITSVRIGENVMDLGIETFRNCTQLATVTFDNPNAITEIGYALFNGCTSLSNFTLGENVTKIGRLAFDGCTRIFNQSGNVYYLGQGYNDYAFALYPTSESVTNVTIKAACKQVVEYAFYYCRSLQTVTFENNGICTKIGDGAFWDCPQLSNVVLPSGVEEVGEYAFEGCINLTSIHLGDSLKTLGEKALFDCGTLEISVPSTIERVGVLAFGERWNAQYETTFYDYNYKDDIGYIGNEDNPYVVAMYVENLVQGQNVIVSKDVATFDENCKIIYDKATVDCDYLHTIYIPATVTYVGKNAFSGEYTLTGRIQTIYVESEKQIEPWHTSWVAGNKVEIIFCIIHNRLTYAEKTDGTLAVSGYIATPTGELIIPSEINGKTVNEIYDNVFANCTGITSITIPDTVMTIGNNAFSGCANIISATMPTWAISYIPKTNLQTVVITTGDKIDRSAFYGCSSLTSVTIPDSVTAIGYRAFYGCDSLTSITIPDSVTTIGYQAFDGCPIQTATIPALACAKIVNGALQAVVITSGDTIESHAFYDCSSLANITIPDSVTTIGDSAFYHCFNLTSITIPDSVTTIGARAFEGCNSLNYNEKDNLIYLGNENNPYIYLVGMVDQTATSVTIDSTCKFIGAYAFYRTSLTSVTIGNSVTTIGDAAFCECYLTSVTIGNSVTAIRGSAFYGCPDSLFNVYENVKYLGTADNPYYVLIEPVVDTYSSYTIHAQTKIIADGAFHEHGSLTSITIPDSVTTIGEGAFYYCRSLTSVTIGDSVTTIGDRAFEDYDNLEEVYYKGTASRWANISSSTGFDWYSTIYYYIENEEDLPTDGGNYWHYVDGGITVW